MWPFSKKQAEVRSIVTLEDIQTLNKRWIDVEARVCRLEVSEDAFRDKVLRKVQKQKGEAEELNTDRPGIIGHGNNSQRI